MTGCTGDCPCSKDQGDDAAFWERVVCLLLSGVALIEEMKLHRSPTTKELRDAGKKMFAKS